MAPLVQTLALLTMAVANVAMEVWHLDMAQSSFDDQYLKCSDSMTKSLPELQSSDFLNNSEFAKNWTKAAEEWEKRASVSSPLTPDQAIALMAHTMDSALYDQFNAAVHEAGNSSRKYREEFHFKSLHFLLTRALQTLRRPNDCRDMFLGLRGVQTKVKQGDRVRFGIFMPMLLNEMVAWDFGDTTKFKVHTCHGVEVQKFSMYPWQEHALIPPFETFNVTAVSKERNTTHIELLSTGTFSNYDCEWLKGDTVGTTWGIGDTPLHSTVAMEVVPLDMAQSSFDDQYLKCSDIMTKSLPELQHSDFIRNSWFADLWAKAAEEWQNKKTPSSPLTQDQAIALLAYTTGETKLHEVFNTAMREAGSSSRKYQDEFHFKSLHFLLTRALQTLRRPNDCRDMFRGETGLHFKVKQGDQVRFGEFVPSETVALEAGRDTIFKVHTCHGVEIQKFSKYPVELRLIPPFETFNVTAVREKRGKMYIELHSTGTFSNYDCEWLKGGSLPRNSPHLWELLLVTMAMAAVSGTL